MQYPDIDEDFNTPTMNAEAEEELDIEVNEAEPYVQFSLLYATRQLK